MQVIEESKNEILIRDLYDIATKHFDKIEDTRASNKKYSISTALKSVMALFSLKYDSLLSFDLSCKTEKFKDNLQKLFGIKEVPSDTQTRAILDNIDYKELKKSFINLINTEKGSKILNEFQFYNGKYIVAIDGTGVHSSENISCDHCLTKKHKDGSITYEHQMLCCSLIHPDNDVKISLPIGIEFIINSDGNKKNDCETNASKRLLQEVAYH